MNSNTAAVRLAGAAYLVWLGLRLWRAPVAVGADGMVASSPTETRPWRIFGHAWLVTALNPKGMVFFVAFLPQFINSSAAVTQQLWVLAVTFVVMATLNATLYAVFAGSARKVLSSSRAQRRFNLTGGSLLSVAGVWALLAKRAA